MSSGQAYAVYRCFMYSKLSPLRPSDNKTYPLLRLLRLHTFGPNQLLLIIPMRR